MKGLEIKRIIVTRKDRVTIIEAPPKSHSIIIRGPINILTAGEVFDG